MEIKVKNYNNQSTLISSILLFITGAILWYKPEIFITTISKVIGIILLVISIFYLLKTLLMKKEENYNPTGNYISIAFLLTLAILFLFFSETIEKAIRLVVGFWILFSGINRLITALQSKKSNTLSLVIVSLLLIIVGIYTIMVGDVIISVVGIILMIYSAIDIIGYIIYKKDDTSDVEVSEITTLITTKPKTEEKKRTKKLKRIKDVETDEK